MEVFAGQRQIYAVSCIDDVRGGLQPAAENGNAISSLGGSSNRLHNYAAHKRYQHGTSDVSSPHHKYIRKLMAGPLLSDDGKYMIGSCFILEGTRQEVEDFIECDPFHQQGVSLD
mmetsp:Transcript_4615/g.7587  ORF Transcript_4615/g.7587 Transcript_4615/m.7587 type:complete len:115 (+) Transcript_4615:1066-1410(+)